MNGRHCSPPSDPPPPTGPGAAAGGREGHPPRPPSFLVRAAVRMSRARWYALLRRVFRYQNGMRTDSAANPLNSGTWLALELTSLLLQIAAVAVAVAVSREEEPVWPLRAWAVGYNLGNLFSLPVLYWRYRCAAAGARTSDVEQLRPAGDQATRSSRLMQRASRALELYLAVWFVMGNIWVFDGGSDSFGRAPVLHTLCVALLAWNAVGYSFPFLLFLLLCCCVPLVGSVLGYNMNAGSEERGASDEEIARLPHWRLADGGGAATVDVAEEDLECCICLTRYDDKEELRQLPCSHLFHLGCVDQWLKIAACCPLCKQELER